MYNTNIVFLVLVGVTSPPAPKCTAQSLWGSPPRYWSSSLALTFWLSFLSKILPPWQVSEPKGVHFSPSFSYQDSSGNATCETFTRTRQRQPANVAPFS